MYAGYFSIFCDYRENLIDNIKRVPMLIKFDKNTK